MGRHKKQLAKVEFNTPVEETQAIESPMNIITPFITIQTEELRPETGSIAVQVTLQSVIPQPPSCICEGYEGQGYFCTLHKPKVECPHCHCIDTEREIVDNMPSVKHYACNLCGTTYIRITETGEYQE